MSRLGYLAARDLLSSRVFMSDDELFSVVVLRPLSSNRIPSDASNAQCSTTCLEEVFGGFAEDGDVGHYRAAQALRHAADLVRHQAERVQRRLPHVCPALRSQMRASSLLASTSAVPPAAYSDKQGDSVCKSSATDGAPGRSQAGWGCYAILHAADGC